jgi:hypothetical protein
MTHETYLEATNLTYAITEIKRILRQWEKAVSFAPVVVKLSDVQHDDGSHHAVHADFLDFEAVKQQATDHYTKQLAEQEQRLGAL